MDYWRGSPDGFEVMRGDSDDHAAYAVGWTISGVVTLGAIMAVWVFGF